MVIRTTWASIQKWGGGTEPEPTPAHSCVGTWTGTQFSSTQCTLVVNADGTLDFNGTKGEWTSVNENEITFTLGDNTYSVNSATKTVNFEYDYTDYSWSSVTFTPAQVESEPIPDSFLGEWRDGNYKIVITADSVTIDEFDDGWGANLFESESVSFSDGVLTANINGDEYTITFDEAKNCLIVNDVEYISADAKDALAGVWKGRIDDKVVTFEFDGSLLMCDGAHSLTITWTDGQEYVLEYIKKFNPTGATGTHVATMNDPQKQLGFLRYFFFDNGDGTLSAYATDSLECGGNANDVKLYREADFPATEEPELDAIAGTWTKTGWEFTFDGKGSVTITRSSGSTTIDYTFDKASQTATFTYGGSPYTAELRSNGKLYITETNDYLLDEDEFTKQA